jgi:hypothetical protein
MKDPLPLYAASSVFKIKIADAPFIAALSIFSSKEQPPLFTASANCLLPLGGKLVSFLHPLSLANRSVIGVEGVVKV